MNSHLNYCLSHPRRPEPFIRKVSSNATLAVGLEPPKANRFKCAFKFLMSKRCANQGGTPAKDENARI
jgi:hypothetical protein